jgi:hypothetical protein
LKILVGDRKYGHNFPWRRIHDRPWTVDRYSIMTAQYTEKLRYDGGELSLCTHPLGDYFILAEIHPNLTAPSSALWRGYVGTWEVVDGRLYLVKLVGTLADGTAASVATFFPEYPDRVFAHWYTGTLRAPQGELLKYVHQGYGSKYESDLLITVASGVVTMTTIKHNGTAVPAEHTKDGFRVNAMTVFPLANGERQDA